MEWPAAFVPQRGTAADAAATAAACCCGWRCVLVTALGVTLLAVCWGTPQPLPRRRDLPPRPAGARLLRDRQPGRRPNEAATRRCEQLPPEERTERPRRGRAARPCAPVVDHYPPGIAARAARPADHRSRSSPCSKTSTEPSSTAAAPPTRSRRGVALFLVLSLLSMLVVLYVVRFQHGLAAEPAQGRRRLRPGAADAGPGPAAQPAALARRAGAADRHGPDPDHRLQPAVRPADVAQPDAGHDRHARRPAQRPAGGAWAARRRRC